MNWRPITKWLLVITAVVWAAYDFLPFLNPARGDTISEVIAEYGLHLFSLPFAFGILMGHFFFLRDGALPKPRVLIPVMLAVIGLDVLTYFTHGDLSMMLRHAQTYTPISFIAGIPVGTLFWPQQKSDKL